MDPILDGKTIDGFPAYRVTPDGNIWSLYVRGSHRLADEFRLMKFGVRTTNYKSRHRRVILIAPNGDRHSENVHVLILTAFRGPCPEGMEGCHNNGNGTDNRLDNLRWDTRTSNQQDRLKHGTACEGEDHYLTKLTDEIVVEIRKEYSEGVSLRRLAQKHNVVEGTIRFIVQRKTWKHLKETHEVYQEVPTRGVWARSRQLKSATTDSDIGTEKSLLIDLNPEMGTRGKRKQPERLNEETPLVGDAIVRSHGNNNHERLAEMTNPA